MAKKELKEIIEVPEGIIVNLEDRKLTVTGEKGAISREYNNPKVSISFKDNKIELISKDSKKEKAVVKSYLAHIKNAFKGCTEGFTYKLKICSGHFPMNVSVANNILTIKNFLGEKVPRTVKLNPKVKVKVEGDLVVVEATDKEKAGQTAADIEQRTRRPGFDKRIFQDGIYIVEKAGKEI